MLLFLALLIVCLLHKMEFSSQRDYANPLKTENVLPLRGLCAIEIVLGHAYGSAPSGEILYLNNRIGVWVVGIFFLLSGYGLAKSLHTKENYLQHFLRKRVWKIFLPVIITYVIKVLQGTRNSFFFELILDWFVCEIIVIYLIWYVLYKNLEEKKAFIIMLLLTVFLNVFGAMNGIGSRWYGSTACFLLGILLERYETIVYDKYKENYKRIMIFTLAAFGTMSVMFILLSDVLWLYVLLINMTCFFCCAVVYLLFMKIRLKSEILILCGKISWEIYLTHWIVIKFCTAYFEKITPFMWMLFLFCGTVLLAMVVATIERLITEVGRRIAKIAFEGI